MAGHMLVSTNILICHPLRSDRTVRSVSIPLWWQIFTSIEVAGQSIHWGSSTPRTRRSDDSGHPLQHFPPPVNSNFTFDSSPPSANQTFLFETTIPSSLHSYHPSICDAQTISTIQDLEEVFLQKEFGNGMQHLFS
jgi:hypothetical protein